VVTYLVCRLGAPGFGEEFPGRLLTMLVIASLSLMAYVAGFALLSLWTRWAMILGILYTVLFEFLLNNIDFALRRLTVNYYFRVVAVVWIGLDAENKRSWAIEDPPSAFMCVLTLLGMTAVATVLGMMVFSRREFHVKTPE